jgi:hypothetical protein
MDISGRSAMLKPGTILVSAVRVIYPRHRTTIERLKRDCRRLWNTPQFVWEQLLRSFSTMGNARGLRLMHEPSLHDRVTYDAIANLGPKKRRKILGVVLAAAPVRMAEQKAGWLCANFDRIRREGGPDQLKIDLCACVGKNAKIDFLKTFEGIGDKYARNIMMDAYHREFRDSIAYDERLKKIAKALDLHFDKYSHAEEFFLEAAHTAGLNGWGLDRLLYHATDQVLHEINGARPKQLNKRRRNPPRLRARGCRTGPCQR